MRNTEVFDVVMKENVQIKKTDGIYTIITDSGVAKAKDDYQPILKALHSGLFLSKALLASLTDGGSNELSANLILAQFLIDYANYIV